MQALFTNKGNNGTIAKDVYHNRGDFHEKR